jgi:hypothetical protein
MSVKKEFWEITGAYCRKCGYDKSIRSLHCHHLDKNQKKSSVDTIGASLQNGRESTIKYCQRTRFIVLCANCHGELHDGLWDVPTDYLGDNLIYSIALNKERQILKYVIENYKIDGINRNTHKKRIKLFKGN